MDDLTPESAPPASEPRHRAPGRRRRTVLVVCAAVLAVGAAAVGMVVYSHDDPKPAAAAPTTSSVPRPTPTPTPTTPTPTPTPTPTKPPIPHQAVQASAPTKFRFVGKGEGNKFTIDADVCGMADVRPLDPPGNQETTVCWVETDNDFGGNEPSHDSGTTYILGHSWAPNPDEVLNPISSRATKEILDAKPVYVNGVATYPAKSLNGSLVTLWTPTAKLVYKVRSIYGVEKYQAGEVDSLMDKSIKKRLVIITCAERNGTDYDYNVIVNAYLYSSQKRSAANA